MQLIEYNKVKMTDHILSKYLMKNKWKGKVIKSGRISYFVTKDNILIATVIYNNSKCTRDIYLPIKNNITIKEWENKINDDI